LYVVDASSLLAVSPLCGADEARSAAVFDDMYRLVRQSELGFPACVPALCRAFDTANYAATWASPVHDGMRIRTVPHSYQADVCPDLSDAGTSDDEEVQVELIAYALHFQRLGIDITVVTEEISALPFRLSVAQAAHSLGMDVLTMGEFMHTRGV
jgi:hypothetical protein